VASTSIPKRGIEHVSSIDSEELTEVERHLNDEKTANTYNDRRLNTTTRGYDSIEKEMVV